VFLEEQQKVYDALCTDLGLSCDIAILMQDDD
jgi:hypothetical protein